jgi:hypothetical protein
MVAQRRLANAQASRRAAKMSLFGDGDKITKLFDIEHYSDFQINNG